MHLENTLFWSTTCFPRFVSLLLDKMLYFSKPTFLFKLMPVFTFDGSVGKESAWSAGDLDSIPGLGRSLEEGNGNPLQYSCLENSKDSGPWQATVHRVAKSWTWLSNNAFFFLSTNYWFSFCLLSLISGFRFSLWFLKSVKWVHSHILWSANFQVCKFQSHFQVCKLYISFSFTSWTISPSWFWVTKKIQKNVHKKAFVSLLFYEKRWSLSIALVAFSLPRKSCLLWT